MTMTRRELLHAGVAGLAAATIPLAAAVVSAPEWDEVVLCGERFWLGPSECVGAITPRKDLRVGRPEEAFLTDLHLYYVEVKIEGGSPEFKNFRLPAHRQGMAGE